MKRSRDKNLKHKTLSKIHFLEDQLVSLDHYLPETYEYLMKELDLQKRNLAEIEIEEHFASIDANEKCPRKLSKGHQEFQRKGRKHN